MGAQVDPAGAAGAPDAHTADFRKTVNAPQAELRGFFYGSPDILRTRIGHPFDRPVTKMRIK